MTVLALDLGTTTGWCMDPRAKLHGFWDLKPNRFDGGGMRFLRFRNRLDEIGARGGISQVVYEEVRRHKGVDAAHIYGGLQATLTLWCEEACIPYAGVPVGTIKRYWTGNGAASKPAMLLKAATRGFTITDDNECDAVALWHYWDEVGAKS